jgi:hypothetical protein
VNAAIDVGKRQLEVVLGSAGERLVEPNEPRAIRRLTARLAATGCERVLLEGGSYLNSVGGGAARGRVAGSDYQSAPGARVRQEYLALGQD